MKRCLKCTTFFEGLEWHCPDCGWKPDISCGILIFATELESSSSDFDASYFTSLVRWEARHFWFRARNALIIWALGKYAANASSFIEVGCGTGFVLQGIARSFPKMRLVGSEIYLEGIMMAAERIKDGEFIQADAREIPFVSEYDAAGAFDLIEHIQKDELVLQQIYSALKPNGLLLLTVPQHRWLWSLVDEYSLHKRRYTARVLHDKMRRAGFNIERSTSFVTSLLPFMFISRLLKRGKSKYFVPQAESRIHPIMNRIFEGFMRLEFLLIRMGVSFPIGGSRLVVAKKVELTER